MLNQAIPAVIFKEPGAPKDTPPLLLFFSEVAVKDERASRVGPPVFYPVHQVRVVVAGSKGNEGPIYEMARKVGDEWKLTRENRALRFLKPYEDWKAGRTTADEGTPLEQWPLMDVAMVAAFKAANVYTVQQLAALPDSALDNAIRRGGREWRAKAQAWLDEAKQAAGDTEARAQIAKLQEELAETQKLLREALKKQNTPGYDAPKRGRAKREEVDDSGDVAVVEEPDMRL